MDREAWHAAVHGITKSQTWLSDWTELKALTIRPPCNSYSVTSATFIILPFLQMRKLRHEEGTRPPMSPQPVSRPRPVFSLCCDYISRHRCGGWTSSCCISLDVRGGVRAFAHVGTGPVPQLLPRKCWPPRSLGAVNKSVHYNWPHAQQGAEHWPVLSLLIMTTLLPLHGGANWSSDRLRHVSGTSSSTRSCHIQACILPTRGRWSVLVPLHHVSPSRPQREVSSSPTSQMKELRQGAYGGHSSSHRQ